MQVSHKYPFLITLGDNRAHSSTSTFHFYQSSFYWKMGFVSGCDWEGYDNYCVSSTNQDLPETSTTEGDSSITKCKEICSRNFDCSAIEWYDPEWNGSKCKLLNGEIKATQGQVGGTRWKDAQCFVKPKLGLYNIV